MKVAIVVLCAAFITVASAVAPMGTCGGSCTSSAACANGAGDLLCRCINFVCSITPPCGGGCVTDGQCADWAGGDKDCKCSWFSCKQSSLLDAPGYNPFLEIAMTKMSKEKRKEVQPSHNE